ncbi:MAG: tRNA dihydrouridine(20/20a) synthase DusA [Gammaproteobacteria bacterium]|nr:tRNA dihydrouridine(20/20a) synthase DusA [Gammaproteobacteria bacterium]
MSFSRKFCVAPMMDYTDRHDRYFLRLISQHAVLYTEMITTGAVMHGDRERLLGFDQHEHPVAVQLGGSNPHDLATSAYICEDYGYDEVNLNVGCPSDRVKAGAFGASLMAQPDLVARCIDAMQQRVDIPVTIKCRIGIDDMDSYEDMLNFVDSVANVGCSVFIVHARKAWLQGLSPKENRAIPPLRYDDVYRLKRERPNLEIIINGGITRIDEMQEHLEHVDGVMVGRAAYHNPFLLAQVDELIYQQPNPGKSRRDILQAFLPYVQAQLDQGVPLKAISRHILGLFQGVTGAKAWRRYISENAYKKQSGIEVLEHAAQLIQDGI